MLSPRPRNRTLIGAGAVGVLLGIYFPWAKPNPGLPPDTKVPTMAFSGLHAGFSFLDVPLFALVGLVVLSRVSTRDWLQSGALLAAGVGVVGSCLWYGVTLFGVDAKFVPAFGWYAAVLGGFLLLLVGGCRTASTIREREKRE